MPKLNYDKALLKAEKTILLWKKRFLTPLGKVTIIKTFILSTFNHLFMTLPSPTDLFLKTFNQMLFRYLWDDKPDKIKRVQITQDYLNGGIKMIDIKNFVLSIKITWIRRLINSEGCDWVRLFENNVTSIKRITTLGPTWCKDISLKIKNIFWKEILMYWYNFCQNNFIKYNSQIMSTPIWCNPKISKNNLFLSHWYKKGIIYIGDIVDNDGNILSQNSISTKFDFYNINFLEYFRVRSCLNEFIDKFKKDEYFSFHVPCIPNHLETLLRQRKGSRNVYDILNQNEFDINFKRKWARDFSYDIFEEQWKTIFRACFKTIKDNFLIWFQYRIIHRILGVGTKKLLFEIKLRDSSLCSFCQNETESLMHLFVTCPIVSQFWNDIQEWILNVIHLNLNLSDRDKILGSLHSDVFFLPMNTIILVTKYYIFTISKTDRHLNIFELQKKIKIVYEEQLLVAQMNNKQTEYIKKWARFENLFVNI